MRIYKYVILGGKLEKLCKGTFDFAKIVRLGRAEGRLNMALGKAPMTADLIF